MDKLPAWAKDAIGECPGEVIGFGKSSVGLAVENRVSGIDEGINHRGLPVLFAIWTALKQARVEMPFPRRVVEPRTAGR